MLIRGLLILAVVMLLCSPLLAQEADSTETDPQSDKRVKFAAVPIVNYDPSFEWNFAALVNVFFKASLADTVSPLSMAGGMLGYTTNGTWYWALVLKLSTMGSQIIIHPYCSLRSDPPFGLVIPVDSSAQSR